MKNDIINREKNLEMMLNLMPDVVLWQVEERSLQIEYVSESVEDIFGIASQSLLQNPNLWMSMVHLEDRKRIIDFFAEMRNNPKSNTIDFRIINAKGKVRWISNRINHDEKQHSFSGATFDITNKQESRERIEFLAYHDPLTKLPNREFLKRKLLTCIEKEPDCALSVLFLDLNNFKYINDTLGHEIGDKVLIQVGERIKESLEEHEDIVRFGGDEFIIVKRYADSLSAVVLAQKIIDLFHASFSVSGSEFDLSCSIGVSSYPEHCSDSVSLVQNADTAMYSAKNMGQGNIQLYSRKLESKLQQFYTMNALIKSGIEKKYFSLYYQPIVSSKAHQIVGFEALLRLDHPDHGLISPADFVPVAEKSGDIIHLGAFVLEEASRFAKKMKKESIEDFFISVNVSAAQFKDGFAKDFLDFLQNLKLPTHFIKVELTETVMMENIEISKKELEKLSEAGIRISLDDFGTGYSSFEYLATLPIETIKIDRSFIKKMNQSDNDAMIVKTIAKMSYLMDKNVVAEGVETLEQVNQLKKFKVASLQGYYFHEPMSEANVMNYYREPHLSIS